MKRIYYFLTMLFAFFTNANSQSTTQVAVSEQQAFDLVMQKYDANQVDVFLLNDTSSKISNQSYTYFIDEEPMKGWEHNCCIITVPKHINAGDDITISTQKLRMAPTGNFEIRHLMPRNSTYDSHRPIVSFGQTNDIQQQSANHTQAIILSGGYNMANNYQRYWNDCSFKIGRAHV